MSKKNKDWSYNVSLKNESGKYVKVGSIDNTGGNIFEQMDELMNGNNKFLKKCVKPKKEVLK